jgi:hypothetical protein
MNVVALCHKNGSSLHPQIVPYVRQHPCSRRFRSPRGQSYEVVSTWPFGFSFNKTTYRNAELEAAHKIVAEQPDDNPARNAVRVILQEIPGSQSMPLARHKNPRQLDALTLGRIVRPGNINHTGLPFSASLQRGANHGLHPPACHYCAVVLGSQLRAGENCHRRRKPGGFLLHRSVVGVSRHCLLRLYPHARRISIRPAQSIPNTSKSSRPNKEPSPRSNWIGSGSGFFVRA